MDDLAIRLGKTMRGEVRSDEATLTQYSYDYSIFKVVPRAVVFPKDVGEVSALVRFATERKKSGEDISLTARAAGSDMSGGPLNDSIIVDFTKYFNHIKEITPSSAKATEGTAVAEPGVYFRDFEKAIAAQGFLYPPYPASKDLCAIGGIIANNSGGEKTLQYGKTEDYVEELTVVLVDGEAHVLRPLTARGLKEKIVEKNFEGEIYRKMYELVEKNYEMIHAAKPDVSKNSAGYALWNVWNRKTFNLAKLFVGSQGTLGFVTEAKLRLVKSKKYTQLLVVFTKSLVPVPQLVAKLLSLTPESVESYDDKTLGLALRFFPALLKLMKGNALRLAWQFLPEVGMALRGGLPKMVLLVSFAGDDEDELTSRLASAKEILKKFPVQARMVKSEAEAQKYWTIRRQSFKLLHSNVKGRDAAPFVDDFVVKPEYMPEVLPKVNAVLDRYKDKLIYTIAGHPGDGNYHIIPLVDLKDPKVRALIPKIMEEVYKIVLRYGGSITAEHNDGLIRTPYLPMMYGEKMYKLFGEVKKIFDPLGIFNPRKKIGTDLKYVLRHIKR